MPIPTEPALTLNGWTYRQRPASASPARLLLMLHGWTGDENSMGFFTRNLVKEYCALLPRAPLVEPRGGYTWRQLPEGSLRLPRLEDLRPSVQALLAFLLDWSESSGVPVATFDVVGFSQGAAMGYALAALAPGRIGKLAALSGFLPAGCEAYSPAYRGMPVLITHGVADEIVPVAVARQARGLMEAAGADLWYCETEGGHKVGRECLKNLELFLGAPEQA